MYTVYRFDKSPRQTNHYGICRDETWAIQLDQTFPSLEEAEAYVIQRNLAECSYDLCLHTGSLTQEVVRSRTLTDDRYLSKRRYFLGKPDIEEIGRQLQADHVRIV
jgi:hypothetical protein